MRFISIVFLLLFYLVSSAFGAGLGDTTDSIKRKYGNKLYIADADCFGNPSRVGNISGNTRGLFNTLSDVNPTAAEFFYNIKQFIPTDSKQIASYRGAKPWIYEIYEFKSESLKKVPEIKTSMRYDKQYFNYPVGSFFLIVNYDIDDKNRVAVFHLVLGRPGEVDLDGMKKVSKNPFK